MTAVLPSLRLAVADLSAWSNELVSDAHRLLCLSLLQVQWTDVAPPRGWLAAHQIVVAEFERRNSLRPPKGLR